MSEWKVERTVVIRARRSTVFRYFTDSERFAAWWGKGSSIDGKLGGKIDIRYPGGALAGGEVVELVPDERVVFTYGYDDPEKPIPRGGSRVTVTLADHAQGTLLTLVHEVGDAKTRDDHVPGWRFQLSLFANVVAREAAGDFAARADRWFAMWSIADAAERRRAIDEVATEDVELRDAFAAITGAAELAAHVAAAQMHMPGVALAREGEALVCQGTALVDWTAKAADGSPRGRGTNVFTLAPDGRIAAVTGFWRPGA
jgi:uncharacterized protein YndB with AHSA1/START domain